MGSSLIHCKTGIKYAIQKIKFNINTLYMSNCRCKQQSNCSSNANCSSGANCNDTRPIDKCNELYRCINCHNKIEKLNINAPICLLSSTVYRPIYDTLYEGILKNNIEIFYNNLIQANSVNGPSIYNDFLNKIITIFNITLGTASPRITLTQPDGTVVIDTYQSALVNTYANWKAKTIDENLNSRVAFIATQLFVCGVGYETKLSSITNTNQASVAIRLGEYLNNPGSIRLSINV